jgi:hypothetical protein
MRGIVRVFAIMGPISSSARRFLSNSARDPCLNRRGTCRALNTGMNTTQKKAWLVDLETGHVVGEVVHNHGDGHVQVKTFMSSFTVNLLTHHCPFILVER